MTFEVAQSELDCYLFFSIAADQTEKTELCNLLSELPFIFSELSYKLMVLKLTNGHSKVSIKLVLEQNVFVDAVKEVTKLISKYS